MHVEERAVDGPTAASSTRVTSPADIAVHHEAVDPGPSTLMRAVIGLALGVASGIVTAVLTSRDAPSAAPLDPVGR
jgi:ABC-type nitrate/sulfonate/bicarbonate transport system permease component